MKRVKDFRSIKDISNISQITFKNKLITIVGEYHGKKENISKKDFEHISLADFIKERVKLNENIRICLEWNQYNREPLNTGSHNINEIYTKLKENNMKNLYFFDNRGWFVEKKLMDDFIYYGERNLFAFSPSKIVELFIKPFFDKYIFFNVHKNLYNNKNFEYLGRFLTDLEKNFNSVGYDIEVTYRDKILDKTLNAKDKRILLDKFRNIWMKVCDYYLLIEILRNDTDEFIILVGDAHRKHLLEDIFKKEVIFKSNKKLNNIYALDVKKKKNKSLTLTKTKYINSIESPKSKVIKSLKRRTKTNKKSSKSRKIKTT